MPINDNNPERKNLIILSISIILFYLADGTIDGNVIRLPIINIKFNNPSALIYFIWTLLAWFLYRYWLNWQRTWREPFIRELNNFNDYSFIIYSRLVKKFSIPSNQPYAQGCKKHIFNLQPNNAKKIFNISATYTSFDEDGKSTIHNENLNSKMDKFYLILIVTFLFFRRPTLSTYFMPYLIATSAILLAA